ncbi:melatonin receptor type 1A-like [Physella acuta]|uniref:melatonin receptor type 1A-like n=1 Tax=Physella acuta TaxID=109671 RepID=UPI0027DC178E|nr:melatonin receptor type 1A-like [Physella acuta]
MYFRTSDSTVRDLYSHRITLTFPGYVVPWTVVGLVLNYYPVVSFGNCVFNGLIIVVGYVASLQTLMVISVNRYLNICHTDLYNTIFSRSFLASILYCSLIWVFAFLSVLPPLLGWGEFHFDKKTHYCGYDRTDSFSYTLFLLLSSIGVPVIIVFYCNFAIWRFIRQASHRIYGFKAHARRKTKLITPDELNLIKSLFVIFICFAVLMSPYMLTTLFDTGDQWSAVVHLTCSYTSFTNSCINWLVYGLMNKNFKRAYKKLFCLRSKPARVGVSSVS